MTQPREVNHWIYFKSKENRDKYADKVKEKDFKIEDAGDFGEYDKEFKYKLRISRVDGVGQNEVDDVLYLWELANELDGDYDGWETSVELEESHSH